MRRTISMSSADDAVAIFRRGSSGRAHRGVTHHLDPAPAEGLRQVRGGPQLRVVDVATLRADVPAEGERRRERHLVRREVVLPTLGPPVAGEGTGVADDGSGDPRDPGALHLLRQEVERGAGHLRVAVAHQPQVPVQDAVDRFGDGHRPRGDQAVGLDRRQERHGQQELLVRGRDPGHGGQVPVPEHALVADRHRHLRAADQRVDPPLPPRLVGSADVRRAGAVERGLGGRGRSGQGQRQRDGDRGDGDQASGTHDRTMVRAREG